MTDPTADKHPLVVRPDDLPATARELVKLLARSGRIYQRGGPVRVLHPTGAESPRIELLTPDSVVVEIHKLAQPIIGLDGRMRITLPHRLARLSLALDDWGLNPLKGVTTAPLLSADGAVRIASGYDPESGLWCCNLPSIELPVQPSHADAQDALKRVRQAFRTFPFCDAQMTSEPCAAVPVVDQTCLPGDDESSFLVGLLTAVCRPSLPLAPGLLIGAPFASGAGAGKGLLVRAICEIAFGVAPYAVSASVKTAELEKRLGAMLIEACPTLFLDNLNRTVLRSDMLASVLTEPLVKTRQLCYSRMLPLSPNAFVVITGNDVSVSEDLARRFLVLELDPRTEAPESRPFMPGFLTRIASDRVNLLTDMLTIWRWGRQNETHIPQGRPLGSYEIWGRWVRDPLLALGCCDPVDRMAKTKTRDPARLLIQSIFEEWWKNHNDKPVSAHEIHESVRVLLDPQGCGRQYVAFHFASLANTRLAGFVLTRQEAVGKWGAATYALKKTGDS